MTGPSETVRRWLNGFGADVTWGAHDLRCPHLEWAGSGAMWLTGQADNAPELVTPHVTNLLLSIREALGALTKASGAGASTNVVSPELLSIRAGAAGLHRRGQQSVGGATRMVRCASGWAAVTLSRPEDYEAVPALLGVPRVPDPWAAVALAAQAIDPVILVERAQLLGMPAAVLPDSVAPGVIPWQIQRLATSSFAGSLDGALVVDLSSMWAGPLCAKLLGDAGARVVKVESLSRPDGARRGNPAFYDWLHAGHYSVGLHLEDPIDRRHLRRLLEVADVVIEASRPRALSQMGLAPGDIDHPAGQVWASITGYGRRNPALVAFGDDAAVAGGLVGGTARSPVFCADAIADPLSGVVAALGVAGSLAMGGGHLVDVCMRDVSAAFAGYRVAGHACSPRVKQVSGTWVVECPVEDRHAVVLPPPSPALTGRAAELGVHNPLLESLGRSSP